MNSYEVGQSDLRPWGSWAVIDVGPHHVVKRIVVNPGAILSLQYHHGRSETWVIVAGTGTVTLGEAIFQRGVGETILIPVGAVHRIANEGTEALEFIEVQTGETLDETDIVRLSDSYGRR